MSYETLVNSDQKYSRPGARMGAEEVGLSPQGGKWWNLIVPKIMDSQYQLKMGCSQTPWAEEFDNVMVL